MTLWREDEINQQEIKVHVFNTLKDNHLITHNESYRNRSQGQYNLPSVMLKNNTYLSKSLIQKDKRFEIFYIKIRSCQ